MSKARIKAPLAYLAIFSALTALTAARSMWALGNSVSDVAELWLLAHLGPFSGFWAGARSYYSLAAAFLSGLLIAYGVIKPSPASRVLCGVGYVIWFLPNLAAIYTGT